MFTRLEQLCTEKGVRLSAKRRVILQVIDEAPDHPSVPEIHQRVIGIDPNVSLATVYRTINALSHSGVLSRLGFGDRKARYEEAHTAHHEHLINVATGDIVEFRDAGLHELLHEVVTRLGYQLVDYRLEIYAEPAVLPDAQRQSGRGQVAAGRK